MGAETLRRAASLMRERAEMAAIPSGAGDWFIGAPTDDNRFATVRSSGGQVAHGMADDEAEHIASWHPAVALAVADWLDAEAQASESIAAFSAAMSALVRGRSFTLHGAALTVGQTADGSVTMQADTSGPALVVARAYLGESA